MSERLERVDEIIERSLRGEADAGESERLMAWRRESLANERHYRQLARLIAAARELAPLPDDTRRPTAASIMAPKSSRARDGARSGGHAAAVLRRTVPWSLAAAALLIALYGRLTRAPAPAWGAADVVTGRSEMATVQLRDGSVVRLAPGSRIAVGAAADRREVTLDGRAFFAVARVPGRPFVVRTRHGDATVLGTRFELSTEENDLRLVVVEGRVSLAGASNRVEVRGGEASGVRHGTALPPTPVVDPDRMERWVGKFLVFQATPLSEVARELQRLYGLHVVIADSALAGRTVSGTFTDQRAEDVLNVVCTIALARWTPRADTIVITSQ